jgi:PWWP domain
VYEITGLAMAAKDEADADDNISTNEEEEEAEKESKEKRAWKKLVNKLRTMPSKRHGYIREIVVDAIAAARKAHLKVAVGQLRAALLEYHPQAAGACKAAALKVLENHGGYDADDDDDEEIEEEENVNDEAAERTMSEVPSALSSTAVTMNSSLDGIEDSDHVEWVGMVKDTKTLSRMASLVTAFEKRAMEKLGKVQEERDSLMRAIATWEKEEERRLKSVAKKGDIYTKPSSVELDLEVWANVDFTDEIIMALVEPYPWWPGKKCVAKDPDLEASLNSVNRCLVALFGEKGSLRVVETNKIRPFTGKALEGDDDIDLSGVTKEHRIELEQAKATARRLFRKKNIET